MTAAKHTPVRLSSFTVYADFELRTEDGKVVAVIPHYQHDVAMRMAACWNACEGLSTSSIEELSNIGGVPAMIAYSDDLRREKAQAFAQRDGLLAVVKEADEDFEREGFLPDGPYRKPIRAAIAKATGQEGGAA